jgi:DNA-binding response OmpR family regulator
METKKKILVIDDEADLTTVLSKRLEANGYDVRVAHDGVEALETLKVVIPDVIILDILMPRMDGFSFYKELKKNPAQATIPVIIITARGKMEATFSAMGADEFLAKPFDSQVLLEKVAVLVARTRSERPVSVAIPTLRSKSVAHHANLGAYIMAAFLGVMVIAVVFLIVRITTAPKKEFPQAADLNEETVAQQLKEIGEF